MTLGKRLAELRRAKNLSQQDVEKRSGMLRSYISRLENGDAGTSVETVERYANALGVELYQVFFTGNGMPVALDVKPERGDEEELLDAFRKATRRYQRVLLGLARAMTRPQFRRIEKPVK